MIKVEKTQRMITMWRNNEAWDLERRHERIVKIFGITVYHKIEDHKLTPEEYKESLNNIGFKNGK